MVGGWGVPCPGLRGTVGGGVPCPDLPRPGRGRALGSLLWVGTMRTSGPGPTRRLGKGTLREARTCRVRRPPCGRLWLKRIRGAPHGRAGCRGRGRPGCDAGGRALRVTVIALVPCRLHKLRQHTRLGGPDAACGDRSADPAGSLCAHPWDSLASITLSDAARPGHGGRRGQRWPGRAGEAAWKCFCRAGDRGGFSWRPEGGPGSGRR